MHEPPLQTIDGAPSWTFGSDRVEASLTRDGGHLAPVRFQTARGIVQPFAIAPWATDPIPPADANVLRTLRGDFFCAPFGGNETPWRGERHPGHGETATARWEFAGQRILPDGIEFSTTLAPRIRPGRVTKRIFLRHDETNIYLRHELRGFTGPMCLGHHAMLAFPEEAGPGHIQLSPWHHGRVCPVPFENPEQGGYTSLKTGAPFRNLARVPLAAGGDADLTTYPARPGYEDLVMVSARQSSRANAQAIAWSTVTYPKAGYAWFALKDPRVLASTVLWHSNGGRHYAPWSGRHRRVLGIEDVTSYFHLGLAPSAAPNPLSRAGVPTVLRLQRNRPLVVNYIMGIIALPRGFDRDRIKTLRPVPAPTGAHIELTSVSGKTLRHAVNLDFLHQTISP
ncbi:hypothetical protein Ga0100231_005830 [Opitutaceae bacterium TAV4]|nr:hypothetical protein Ga0100231_005830 [Opitutaceae bacterium TAV4]RRK02497.1 hypothetical protein Ga0100230_005045 [Opitutaceae bacterium TAV3]